MGKGHVSEITIIKETAGWLREEYILLLVGDRSVQPINMNGDNNKLYKRFLLIFFK